MTLSLGSADRLPKPRRFGRTAMIDTGLPLGLFRDVICCHQDYVDAVKFGWATALLTDALPDKIALLRELEIDCWFGGTFFELAWQERKLDRYTDWIRELGMTHVEISDGTVRIEVDQRWRLIRELSADLTVISEIGRKAANVEPDPAHWIAAIRADLGAGAHSVILEGRESGTAGLYDSDGELRGGLIEAILAAGLPLDRLIFEAPRKAQQVWFLRRLGPQTKFGNISWSDLIPLETLRRGLRSDTVGQFHQTAPSHPTRRAS